MKHASLFASLVLLFSLSFAGEFLCGGVGGIPCTTDCPGQWSEASQANVACECPPSGCVCYCPATPTPPPEEEEEQEQVTPPPPQQEEEQQADLCEGVHCDAARCVGDTLYYNGQCDPDSGDCTYNTEVCEIACNASSLSCVEAEENHGTPTMSLSVSRPSVILNGHDSVDIIATLKRPDGTPVSGAKVYFRLNDPKNTGVLGSWGFLDAYKYTDGNGVARGTVSFPSINSVNKIFWDTFPYDVGITATAGRHDSEEDWSAQQSADLAVVSPAPKITSIRIEPNPAQAYSSHNVFVTMEDADSTGEFTYSLEEYGGTWVSSPGAQVSGQTYTFTSRSKSEAVSWMSPVRGLNKDEIVMAREMANNLKGLTINLAATAAEEYLQGRVERLPGSLAGNFVPIVSGAKGIYGLSQNVKSIVDGGADVYNSQNWKERTYRLLNLGLEGGKTTIGAITCAGEQVPVINGLAGATQDLVDALVGTVQAGLTSAASKERILASQKMDADYGFIVTVTDSDGYSDEEFYKFKMEYLGFEGD